MYHSVASRIPMIGGNIHVDGASVRESCDDPPNGRYLIAVIAPVGPWPANASRTPPCLSILTLASSAIRASGRIRFSAQKWRMRCSTVPFTEPSGCNCSQRCVQSTTRFGFSACSARRS
jgi:hypothetical protein